jgi:hypothetical protein
MSTKIGEGIAASPTISLAPPEPGKPIAVDLYVTVSTGVTHTTNPDPRPSPINSPVNILYWKDRRIQ